MPIDYTLFNARTGPFEENTMMGKCISVAISFGLVALMGVSAGQTDRADPKSVAKLIAQLGAKEFRARDQASKGLEKLGKPVLPILRKAVAANVELEAKRRIEQVMIRIENALLETEEKSWQGLDAPRRGIKERLVRILRRTPGLSDQQVVSAIYLLVGGRSPNAEEASRAQKQLKESDSRFIPAFQIARSLVQSKEFKSEVAEANVRILKVERDLAAETEISKRLQLLNGKEIQELTEEVAASLTKAAKTNQQVVELVFLLVLSRFPNKMEYTVTVAHLKKANQRPVRETVDLIWAVINCGEFAFENR
jgi:hypothetical protein